MCEEDEGNGGGSTPARKRSETLVGKSELNHERRQIRAYVAQA